MKKILFNRLYMTLICIVFSQLTESALSDILVSAGLFLDTKSAHWTSVVISLSVMAILLEGTRLLAYPGEQMKSVPLNGAETFLHVGLAVVIALTAMSLAGTLCDVLQAFGVASGRNGVLGVALYVLAVGILGKLLSNHLAQGDEKVPA